MRLHASPAACGGTLTNLYFRSRGFFAPGLWLSLTAVLVASAAAPETLPLLFAQRDIPVQAACLLAVLPLLALAPTFGYSLGEVEAAPSRRLVAWRLTHILVAAVLAAAPALPVLIRTGAADTAATTALDALSLVGMLLATARLLGASLAWFVPVGVAGVQFIAGTDADTGAVRPWAWLLWDTGARQGIVASSLFVAGAALWLSTVRSRALESVG